MSILLDREQMCVRYRHERQQVLWNIMAIEFTHTSVVSMDENQFEAYNRFTDYELKMLYLNLCGVKYTGYARDILIKQVQTLIQSLPYSNLDGFELTIQASKIPDTGDLFYKYVKGSQSPAVLEAPYVPPALTAVAGYNPVPVALQPANAAPVHATQAANPFAAPCNPSTVTLPAEAPKAGSKTGRVWEIAEAEFKNQMESCERFNCKLDVKLLRKLIVGACEAEGINVSTASVQYGKWRNTKVF